MSVVTCEHISIANVRVPVLTLVSECAASRQDIFRKFHVREKYMFSQWWEIKCLDLFHKAWQEKRAEICIELGTHPSDAAFTRTPRTTNNPPCAKIRDFSKLLQPCETVWSPGSTSSSISVESTSSSTESKIYLDKSSVHAHPSPRRFYTGGRFYSVLRRQQTASGRSTSEEDGSS
jgi:hypothetical protein